MNLLIIEDERQLAEAIAHLFEKNNFIVQIALTGTTGLLYAQTGNYDLIILDLMLPGLNGLDILKNLRAQKNHTPILILTAKSTLNDEISGLNLGADDYLTKPFSFDKLYARVKALLRRGENYITNNLTFHDLVLNLDTCVLSKDQQQFSLSSKEFHLLALLIRNNKRITSKDDIMDKVWGYDALGEYNTVEVYISFLRKKITALKSQVIIKAHRNLGYKMEISDD